MNTGDDRALVLIVDDDPVGRAVMSAGLAAAGFATVEAEDGATALARSAERVPALVVADIVMPVMDGLQLCRALRAVPEMAYLPILMVTGHESEATLAAAYAAGATDFIAKPVSGFALGVRVRHLLRAAEDARHLRAALEHFRRASAAAEAASRGKSLFLANMSHELRTPLNAIIGFAEIMREGLFGPLSERYAEYAQIIGDGGAHLLALVNDILDLARAEAEKLELAEGEVDVAAAIAFVAQVTREMARRGDVACSFVVEPALPSFRGDDRRLKQILLNLLTNAIKFTPAGGTVRVGAEREPGAGLVLRIADTGIGISSEDMEKVLAPFGQAETGWVRRHQGAGLGLPLAKHLVELHGGTLEIASTPGIGTTVTARFPRERWGIRPSSEAAA